MTPRSVLLALVLLASTVFAKNCDNNLPASSTSPTNNSVSSPRVGRTTRTTIAVRNRTRSSSPYPMDVVDFGPHEHHLQDAISDDPERRLSFCRRISAAQAEFAFRSFILVPCDRETRLLTVQNWSALLENASLEVFTISTNLDLFRTLFRVFSTQRHAAHLLALVHNDDENQLANFRNSLRVVQDLPTLEEQGIILSVALAWAAALGRTLLMEQILALDHLRRFVDTQQAFRYAVEFNQYAAVQRLLITPDVTVTPEIVASARSSRIRGLLSQ